MKSKAPRAAAGTLCAMLAAAALANDPAPYMGGGKDQALFEAVKDWCWREAAREAGSDEETKKFSLGYADCYQRREVVVDPPV